MFRSPAVCTGKKNLFHYLWYNIKNISIHFLHTCFTRIASGKSKEFEKKMLLTDITQHERGKWSDFYVERSIITSWVHLWNKFFLIPFLKKKNLGKYRITQKQRKWMWDENMKNMLHIASGRHGDLNDLWKYLKVERFVFYCMNDLFLIFSLFEISQMCVMCTFHMIRCILTRLS